MHVTEPSKKYNQHLDADHVFDQANIHLDLSSYFAGQSARKLENPMLSNVPKLTRKPDEVFPTALDSDRPEPSSTDSSHTLNQTVNRSNATFPFVCSRPSLYNFGSVK